MKTVYLIRGIKRCDDYVKSYYWYYQYAQDKFSPPFNTKKEAIEDAKGFGYKVILLSTLYNLAA